MPNDVKRMKLAGNQLIVERSDGSTDIFVPGAPGYWTPNERVTIGILYIRDYDQMMIACKTEPPTFFYRFGQYYLPAEIPTGLVNPPPPSTDTGVKQLLVNWMVAHIGVYAYSQSGGRLTPDTSGYSDCSAIVWYCYKMVTGSEAAIPLVGGNTYTGTQISQGTAVIATTTANSVDESIMQLGDLVFFDWGSNGTTWSFDHVEMYMGGNQTIGHGGGMGPKIKNLQNNVAYAVRVQVRRYL